MNLFENLQKLNESENPIISEFKEFLVSKNAQYVANEIGETKDGMQIIIYDGDWKHEHRYMQNLVNEFFTKKGIDISINSEEIGKSDQDTFSAKYNVEFNTKPKNYTADVKNLKFTTEDKAEGDFSSFRGIYTDQGEKDIKTIMNMLSELKNESQFDDYINLDSDNLRVIIQRVSDITFDAKVYWYTGNHHNSFGEVYKWNQAHSVHQLIDWAMRIIRGIRYIGETKNISNKDKEIIKESSNLNNGYEYVGPATGFNKGWSLYRKIVDGKGIWVAEHQQTKEIVPINYNQVQGFEPIKLDGVKKLQKDLGDMLLPKRESNEEDYDDNAATFLDTLEKEVKDAAHNFMISVGFPEDEADDYLSVSTDINDDYVMVAVGAELGYESISKLCDELNKVIEKHDKDAYFEPECPGRIVAYLFGEKEESLVRIEEANKIDIISIPWPEYLNKEAIKNKEIIKEISDIVNKRSTVFSSDIVKQYAIDAINEYIETHSRGFNDENYRDSLYTQNDEKHFIDMGKQVLKLIQDMPIKNESLNESNHINIDDRDYATGEEMYNEFVKYLNSLDQIGMGGDDCNWDPSEFNAKNLNADGEIYLECGAYILIYPYVNEWAEDYFKVMVVDAETCDLDIQLKNGIERIFNKFKTDKWKLVFEG